MLFYLLQFIHLINNCLSAWGYVYIAVVINWYLLRATIHLNAFKKIFLEIMEWGYLLTSIYNHYWAYFIQVMLQVIDLHSDKESKLLGGAFISINIFYLLHYWSSLVKHIVSALPKMGRYYSNHHHFANSISIFNVIHYKYIYKLFSFYCFL